jgi:autotransporter-associated beta strand protein
MSVSAAIALGGSQQWFNNSSSALAVTGPLYLGLNSLTFSGSGQTSVGAPISGYGNVVVSTGANLVLSTASSSVANSYVGTTQINGALLTLQGPAGSTFIPQASAVSLSSGGTLNLNNVSSTIPLLNADSTTFVQLGNGTLSTGAASISTVVAGAISGNGGVTKVNGSTVVLSGQNTYAGPTTISAGALQINGGNALSPNSTVIFPASTTLNYFNDGTGNNGTISQGNNITLTANSISPTLNVGGLTGLNTGNTVSFGTLTASPAANAFFNTINFTAANSYKQSYAGLNLPGSSGQSTQLNANSGTVIINGPVNNQMVAGGGFDTLFLGGSTTGNRINGNISDGAHFTGVGAGDTRITSNGTGQWILAGTNTYNGPTVLSSGSLQFAGNNALPPNTAISITSLSTGNIGNLQIRADGTGSGSTLNLGNNINVTNQGSTPQATIDVGSLSGASSNVTVSFGKLMSGLPSDAAQTATITVQGNNNYTASFLSVLLPGNSGTTAGDPTTLTANNVNVIIGSPAAITGTAIFNQIQVANSGFDTIALCGSNTPINNGLGNVVYGQITDRNNYPTSPPPTTFLNGETNLTVNGIAAGVLPAGANGSSLWTLAGSEAYHGWTFIGGGTLQLGTGQAGQDGVLWATNGGTCSITSRAAYADVNNFGTFVYNNLGNYTINYSMSGNGALVKAQTDIITLNTSNTLWTGATRINGGTLQLGNGSNTGGLTTSSGITDNAALVFNRNDAVSYTNAISGNGAMYQIGSGTVTMSSLASFTGTIGVNTGSVFINGANQATSITAAAGTTLGGTFSAPSAAATLGSGATLVVGNGTTGSVSLASLGFTSGGTINVGNIGNYYASTGTAAAVSISGNLSAGGAVTLKLGGGQGPVVLGGNYQILGYGGSLLGAGSHSFALNTAGATLPTNGALTLVYGTSAVDVTFSDSNYPIWSGTASTSWTGANWQSSSSSLATAYANNNLAYFGDTYPTTGGAVAVASGAVSLSTTVAPYSAYFANNSVGYTLSATAGSNGIVNAAMLVMTGAGALTINTTNTYTGGTYLYNGLLNLGTSAALGNAPGTLTLAGGTLDNTSGAAMTLPQNYAMTWVNGFGFKGTNALNLGTGAVTLSGSTSSVTLNVSASTLTVGGAISGPFGLTQTGAGTLQLNAADTFTGNTLVSGGVLMLGSATALQNSTLDTSGAGSINFGGLTAATVAGLTNGGALTLSNTTPAAVTLSVGNTNVSSTSSAAIGGLGGITKIGSGLLALTGNNTYGGVSNISAGTLQFQGASALPSGGSIGIGGGVVSIANDGAGSGGTISLNSSNINLTAGATVGIDARGLTGANSNNVVSFGALNNGTTANAFASTINFTAANGYTHAYSALGLSGLTGQGTTLAPQANTSVIVTGNVTNQESGTTVGHFDTLTLGGSSTGNAILGVISNAYSYTTVGNGDTRVTKTGPGQWTLGGANTYIGPTTISAGTLALGPSGSISSFTISIASSATFDVSQVSGFALLNSQSLSGAGNATVNGSMAVSSGAYVLPGGVNSSGTLNVGSMTLNPGSVLAYDFSTTGSVDLINVSALNGLTVSGGSIGLYGTNGTSQFTTPGTYPLMSFNGALGGSVANLSVLNPSGSLVYGFITSGNTLDVTIQQGNVWTGGGGPFNWSVGANWASGLAPTGGTIAFFAGTTGLSNTNDLNGLSLPGITFVGSAGAFSLSGNSIQLGGPIVNSSTSAQTIGLAMQLTNSVTTTINAASGSILLAGAISDAGSGYGVTITTAGASTVTLSAANTFSGPTTISAGRLDLANGLALQNSTLTFSAGSLLFDPSVLPASFTLGGLQGTSALSLAASGTGIPVTLSVGNNNSTTAFSGVLSGPGSLIKTGTGTFTLNSANTYTGKTLVTGGVLQLGNAGALQNSTLDASGGGQINFGSLTSGTVGGLTNGGNLVLQNNTAGAVTLYVGNNGLNNVSSANISDGGSNSPLIKIGAGLQALAGINTYGGGTTISAGTLQFLSTVSGGNSVPSMPSGGTIQMSGGVLSVLADGTGSGGTISAPASNILMTAAATVGINVGNFVSTNTGNTVSFGVLNNGTSANALASTFNVTGANGYGVSFAGLNLPGTTGNNTTLNATGASVVINGPVNNQITTIAGHFDTLFLGGTSLGNQINGVISDSSAGTAVGAGDTRITANGSGQWILAAQEAYHGPTAVSGGTLQLGNGIQDGALYTNLAFTPANTVALSNNAAFVYNLSSNTTVANYVISGAGRMTVLAGMVTAGTANSYTGATTIAGGGTLALNAAGSINNTSLITLGNAALLDVSQVSQPWQLNSGQTLGGTGNYLVNGAISNATGSVIQPGTLAASSAGTLTTGGLTLNGGTLSYELGTGQDLINVTSNGGLNIANTTAINLFDSSGQNQFVLPGSYALMAYNGTLGGALGNLSVGNPSPIDAYSFSTSGSVVYVNITGPSNVWTGNAGAPFDWSVAGNWASLQAPVNGAGLGFAGTTGLTNINDISNLSVSVIAFNSGAGAFNLTGNSIQLSGAITNLGTASQTIGLGIQLTTGTQSFNATGGNIVLNGVISDGGAGYGFHVTGPNALILGAANTYTGATTVNSGTLTLANNQAVQYSTVSLGSSGSMTFVPGTTSPSVAALTGTGKVLLTTSASEAVQMGVGATGLSSTFGGNMRGIGGLVKQGSGTFTLTSPQTYGGATAVSGGVLQLAGLSGFGGTGAGWTLNNSPTVNSDVLQLTFNGANEARSAFNNQRVSTGAFYASFVYQAGGNLAADGVTFVLQNSGSGAGALGITGGSLGYGGITPSAAVAINIYAPNTIGTNYITGGTAGTYLSSSPVNPGSGDPILVTLNYNGASTLTETMSDTVTGQVYSHQFTGANIASAAGGGGLAYLGFTGGDGGAASNQMISNFTYALNNILPTTTNLSMTNGGTLDMTNCLQTVQSVSSTDGMGSYILLGLGGLTIANTANTSTTFDGVISGAGGFVTLQGGGLMLTNQNTFTGPMTVSSSGVLQMNSAGGPALAGNLAVSGGTAVWLQDSQVNSTSNLSVSNGLANIGPHSNTFANVQTTGGTITGTTGVITSTNPVDARSGTINAILGGGAGLNKTTAGTVVLGAANTYSGSTSVAAGTLKLSNPLALQNTAASMNGGVLAFAAGNTSPSVGALTGTGNLGLATVASEPVTLNLGGNGQNSTYSGVMSGAGSLVKQGSGSFSLGNNQVYAGTSVVSNGTLQLGPVVPLIPTLVSGFGPDSSGLNGTNGSWTFNSVGGTRTAITSNVLSLTVNDGTGVQNRSAWLNTPLPVGKFTMSFVYQEATGYQYPSDGATFVLQNSSSGLMALGGGSQGLGYNGITSSAGMGINLLYTQPNQQFWLSGGGTVAGSQPSVSPWTNGNNGNAGNPVQMTLTYDGSNMISTTWKDLTNSNTWSTSYAIGGLTDTVGSSAYIGFTGATGTFNAGPGIGYATQLISQFSYTYYVPGAPIAGNNLLPTLTPLSVTAGATVDLYGGNDAVGSLSGAGTVTNSVTGSLSVLTVGNIATTQTFSGSLQDGGGTLGLHIVAPGGLVLTGQNNTYSGATTINSGGTLQLGNGVGGNDGSISGAGGVANNGLLLYKLAGSQTESYAISGSGAVTKTGGGTLTLANGSNVYTGGTNVLQGLMVVAPGSGALPNGPLFVSGGSLDLEGNFPFVTTLGGSGTIGNGQIGAGNTAYLTVSSGGTWAGTIRDGGFSGNAPVSLVVDGGTLSLTGTNTYGGGTFVEGSGALIVTSAQGLADNTDLTVGDPGQFPAPIVPASSALAQSQTVASVPEPGTLGLLAAIGIVAAAAVRRGRKNRRS